MSPRLRAYVLHLEDVERTSKEVTRQRNRWAVACLVFFILTVIVTGKLISCRMGF